MAEGSDQRPQDGPEATEAAPSDPHAGMPAGGPEAPAPEPVGALRSHVAGASDLDEVFDLAGFEPLARDRMSGDGFDYIAGGSWTESTIVENEAAFRRRRLRPRVLVDVSSIDPSTTMLGQQVALPVALAPTAFQRFAHPEAELASARAATDAGVLFVLSTLSTIPLEEVAAVGSGPRWFQLYVHRDRHVTRDLVQRAEANGYSGLVLTVDLPVPGYRQRDLRNHLRLPEEFGSFHGRAASDDEFKDLIAGLNDRSLAWDDLPWVRGLSGMPLVIKGIMTGEDAAFAVEHGAEAIVVSNHGGRQLDGVSATLDVLEEAVAAVDGRAEVYLDGGVRRGTDVLMALALGARSVCIGRPYLYALAAGGEAGVTRALGLLHAELVTAMALLGVRSPQEITRRHIT